MRNAANNDAWAAMNYLETAANALLHTTSQLCSNIKLVPVTFLVHKLVPSILEAEAGVASNHH
jgi:hypothetical protein